MVRLLSRVVGVCRVLPSRRQWDYCREHRFDLVINGETVVRRGEEIEG
jgi:hypothetical protein